jgi:hypothetical protein
MVFMPLVVRLEYSLRAPFLRNGAFSFLGQGGVRTAAVPSLKFLAGLLERCANVTSTSAVRRCHAGSPLFSCVKFKVEFGFRF